MTYTYRTHGRSLHVPTTHQSQLPLHFPPFPNRLTDCWYTS